WPVGYCEVGLQIAPVCISIACTASCFDGYKRFCIASRIDPAVGRIANSKPTCSIWPICFSPSDSSHRPSEPDVKYSVSGMLRSCDRSNSMPEWGIARMVDLGGRRASNIHHAPTQANVYRVPPKKVGCGYA